MRISPLAIPAAMALLVSACSSTYSGATFQPHFAFRATEAGEKYIHFDTGVIEIPARLARSVLGLAPGGGPEACVFSAEEWRALHSVPGKPHSMSEFFCSQYWPRHRLGTPSEFLLRPGQRGELAAYDGLSYIKGFRQISSDPPKYDPEIDARWEGILLGLCARLGKETGEIELELEMTSQEIASRPLRVIRQHLTGLETPVCIQEEPEVIAKRAAASLKVPEGGLAVVCFPAPAYVGKEPLDEPRVVLLTLRLAIEEGGAALTTLLPGGSG